MLKEGLGKWLQNKFTIFLKLPWQPVFLCLPLLIKGELINSNVKLYFEVKY